MQQLSRFIIGILLFTITISCSNQIVESNNAPEETAIVIIGAASRFSQETALIEQLDKEGQ